MCNILSIRKSVIVPKTRCPVFFAFTLNGDCVSVPCGQWACPECAKKLAKRWAWRTEIHIGHRMSWFLTLTVRGYYKDVPAAYKLLPKWFDNFRKVLQRTLGKVTKLEYIAFVEAQLKTRDGMPHLHIVLLQKPKVRETVRDRKTGKPKRSKDRKVIRKVSRYKDIAWRAGFGYQAKIERINGKKAAGYVAKYASKVDKNMPKGFRRVRASQGWKDLPPNNGEFDLIVKSSTEHLSDYLLRVNDVTNVPVETLLYRWYQLTLENA